MNVPKFTADFIRFLNEQQTVDRDVYVFRSDKILAFVYLEEVKNTHGVYGGKKYLAYGLGKKTLFICVPVQFCSDDTQMYQFLVDAFAKVEWKVKPKCIGGGDMKYYPNDKSVGCSSASTIFGPGPHEDAIVAIQLAIRSAF